MCVVFVFFVLIVGYRCGFSCHISISGVQLKRITFRWFWWIVSKYFSDISKNYCLDDGQTNWRNDRHFWTTVCLSLQSVRTMVLLMKILMKILMMLEMNGCWCWWRNPIWRLVAVITFGPPATITVHPLHWCKTPSLMMKSENQTEMIKARKIPALANKS